MGSLALSVGVDYHMGHLQICALDPQGRQVLNRRCGNSLLELAQAMRGVGDVRAVAIEACTGAADLAEAMVEQLGWSVDMAHSGYVARLKGSPDKTDFSDARLLADLSRVGYLPRVWLAPRRVRLLRQLVHHRQQLINQRRAAKLRVSALMREHRLTLDATLAQSRWSRKWVAAVRGHAGWSDASRFIVEDLLEELTSLGRRLRAAEAQLHEQTAQDAIVQKLLTLAGVGPVTAWTLRAYVGRFDRFGSGKQLSRYCGLSPRNASSGQRQADAGLIRMARPALRAVLLQAGHRLARGSDRWGDLGRSLVARGKPYNVMVAALTNRWLRWMYHQMKDVASSAG